MRFSSFNKVLDKELFNTVTEKSIGFSAITEKFLSQILEHDSSVLFSVMDKVFSLLQKELIFRGIIIPNEVKEETEEWYLKKLFPMKLPQYGFFYSKILDFRGLDKEADEVSILFMSIPCDLGAPRPGTRFGPQILRERSYNFNYRGRGFHLFDVSTKLDLFRNTNIYDIGDISLPQRPLADWLEITQNVVSQLPKKSVPIIIGGDHSLSLAAIKGVHLKNQKPFTLVQLDYHLDVQLWGKFDQSSNLILDKPTHANFMSWVKRDISDIKIFQIGVFDYQSIDESSKESTKILEYFQEFSELITNFFILSSEDNEIYDRLPIDQDVYLTIDIDVINYQHMFQTGFPSATGISVESLIKILRYLCKHNNVIGVDIMEFGKSHKDHEHYEMATLVNCIIIDIIKLGIFNNNKIPRSSEKGINK